jgi:hypothetical protein
VGGEYAMSGCSVALSEVVKTKFPLLVAGIVSSSQLKFSLPVAGSKPKTYNRITTITDMKIKGINTIIHDIIPIPAWQSAFKRMVIIIITITFKKAVLYNPLKVSIIICVREKAT